MKIALAIASLLLASQSFAATCPDGQVKLMFDGKQIGSVNLEKNSIVANSGVSIDTVKFYKTGLEEVAVCGQKAPGTPACNAGEAAVAPTVVKISDLAGEAMISTNFNVDGLTTGRARFEINAASVAACTLQGVLKANKAPKAK